MHDLCACSWQTTKKSAIKKEYVSLRCVYSFLFGILKRKIAVKKEEAIKIIYKCAKLYKENLENRNFLFISSINNNKLSHIEAKFLKNNFKHLTGVADNDKKISANLFYTKCLNNKLSLHDFKMRDDGTTELKLSVLSELMKINKCVKMIGNCNKYKPKLYVDKLAGNTRACIGLSKVDEFYVPITALKEDTRDLITETEKVIAIFSKGIKEALYTNLTYIAKDFEGIDINICPKVIIKKLDIGNLNCSFGAKFIKDTLEESAITS